MTTRNEAGVVAIDIDQRIVFLDTGERCPIVNMFAQGGDETYDADEAVSLTFFIGSTRKWGACAR